MDLHSGLVVEIPEAEPVVGRHRLRLEPQAALGVPAHITALFPFVTPSAIDAALLKEVARVAQASPPFDYHLTTTGWFGDEVLYVAPADAAPFVKLTERLWHAFPNFPPYEGRFAETVPHLTVGIGAGSEELRAAERDIAGGLPVSGRATRVTLMVEGRDGRWTRAHRFPLG